jgi:hypothetical protein
MPTLLKPGHGRGKARPHIEMPSVAELPRGLPAPAPVAVQVPSKGEPRPFGPLPKGSPEAAALSRYGAAKRWEKAKAEAQRVTALDAMGLRLPPSAAMTPFLNEADQLYEHERARIAAECGGGQCGPGPATMLASGCLAYAASRYLYSTCDPSQLALAAKLATESRQHFLAAHTLASLQAESRAKAGSGQHDPELLKFFPQLADQPPR